jgi:hypothetical protein
LARASSLPERMTLSEKPGLGTRLSNLPRAMARLSPRQKVVVALLVVFVVLTWLAACAVLASLFV